MDRCIFYYYCYSTHHHLPSFPTRRSSDLLVHHHAQPDVIVTGLAEVFGEHLRERSEEHTSELQSRGHLVCRLLLEKKNHNYEQAQVMGVQAQPLTNCAASS